MGKHKIFNLAYADDMVMLADTPEELKEMCRILKKILVK